MNKPLVIELIQGKDSLVKSSDHNLKASIGFSKGVQLFNYELFNRNNVYIY